MYQKEAKYSNIIRTAAPTPFLQETGYQPNQEKENFAMSANHTEGHWLRRRVYLSSHGRINHVIENKSVSEMECAEGLTQSSHFAFVHILFVEKCIKMLYA